MDFKELETISILYVEDEDIIRENVTDMLQEVCFEIFTAKNGEDGYQLFLEKQEHIDLIISDIQMPVLSGLDMAKKIREITYDTPIIFTTAFSDSSYLFESINTGVDAYVEKPIDIMHLFKVVKKTILPFVQREALLKQAYTDKLTGIMNRSALDLQLEKNIHSGFILFDISAFKVINDLYGTEMGNFVLKEFAHFLTHQKKDNWDLYRIGSDDFGFLIYNHLDATRCEAYVKMFLENLKKNPIYNHKHAIEININVNIGIVLENENILEKADMALKASKAAKVDYLIYSEQYNYSKDYEDDLAWVSKIDIAIKTNNITPYFQPIVNADGKIKKFECLMRLCEGNKAHSPFFFLDIAKKSRIYKDLTMIMLKQIFEVVMKHKSYDFSINMSQIDIVDDAIVHFILTNIKEKKIASRIIFEILEDESLENTDKFFSFVNAVKALGSKIAIDDFGSGYSNFMHMLEIKPDILKIDGSLIKDINTHKNAFIVTDAITKFAKELGMESIAEFVHSEEVFKITKDLGIDNFQGYYFSEPIPESEISKLSL